MTSSSAWTRRNPESSESKWFETASPSRHAERRRAPFVAIRVRRKPPVCSAVGVSGSTVLPSIRSVGIRRDAHGLEWVVLLGTDDHAPSTGDTDDGTAGAPSDVTTVAAVTSEDSGTIPLISISPALSLSPGRGWAVATGFGWYSPRVPAPGRPDALDRLRRVTPRRPFPSRRTRRWAACRRPSPSGSRG